MHVLILDGSTAEDQLGARVGRSLTDDLKKRGDSVEHLAIRDLKIANCTGCFDCWLRTPGLCRNQDDNRRVASAMVNCDRLIFLTPITFGNYSALLKRGVDHLIQNISPNFVKVQGETHHKKRYDHYPDFFVLGWLERPDQQAEAVFTSLVRRNAINFYAEHSGCDIFYPEHSDGEIHAAIGRLFDLPANDLHPKKPEIRELPGSVDGFSKPGKAVLIVGSPRTLQSTSNALGHYLLAQLETRSVQTETFFIYQMAANESKYQELFQAVEEADLVILAFPLYVDSFPAPVIDAMTRIVTHRRNLATQHKPMFTALVNCGYPEAGHNDTVLSACEVLAKQAGLAWIGGLALGGEHGLGSKPLAEWGGRTLLIRQALDRTAMALAEGQTIPAGVRESIIKPLMPPWIFRLGARYYWKKSAKRFGTNRQLDRKPYISQLPT